ncbi:MBL fold metallo-hydrolase [Montanilutibacter psychrotolerans]|nr:MBL fold metallo-hydrolase [Lysobacter psychrotolerans]
MNRLANALFALVLAATPSLAWSQNARGSLDVRWNAGAADCAASPQAPLQVHAYEPNTIILRQSPCSEFEAGFLYLLIGSDRALLIDTGAVADPSRMPLAKTVADLLPNVGDAKLPLLVVHTHGHGDHDAGDSQFAAWPGVKIAPGESAPLRTFFGLSNWPDGIAHLDLGGRVVDVIPAPGHHPNHLAFYDGNTGLLFSGDFLLPGRLMVDDLAAYRASARRLVDFVRTRPVAHILGGHIELDVDGQLYAWGSTHHSNERPLAMQRADLLALPAALDGFNGFHSRHASFVLTHPIHNLVAMAVSVVVALLLMAWGLRVLLRRRRARANGRA